MEGFSLRSQLGITGRVTVFCAVDLMLLEVHSSPTDKTQKKINKQKAQQPILTF